MAEVIVPSVIDRLLDDNPGVRTEPELYPAQAIRQLHEAVRRDLNNLLNSRRRLGTYPSEFKELEQSVVNYGLPDVTGGNLATPESRKDFLRVVETTLRRFEPRLKSIRVTPLDNAEQVDRTLRFRIDAVLKVGTATESVVFDSRLEPSTGSVEVNPGDA
ncbi:MAG: type VI secretion system baseplate subunit TssE [Gammaproteobacteria bacterium]|nr:type VI secretion system baseplate subunit TssE [Gammaproteobacteria bacterium]